MILLLDTFPVDGIVHHIDTRLNAIFCRRSAPFIRERVGTYIADLKSHFKNIAKHTPMTSPQTK